RGAIGVAAHEEAAALDGGVHRAAGGHDAAVGGDALRGGLHLRAGRLAAGHHRAEVDAARLEAVGAGVRDVVADVVKLRVDRVDAGQGDVEAHGRSPSSQFGVAASRPLNPVTAPRSVSPTCATSRTTPPPAETRTASSVPSSVISGASFVSVSTRIP